MQETGTARSALNIIVGGGLGGYSLLKYFIDKNVPYVFIEKSSELDTGEMIGPQARLNSPDSRAIIKEFFPDWNLRPLEEVCTPELLALDFPTYFTQDSYLFGVPEEEVLRIQSAARPFTRFLTSIEKIDVKNQTIYTTDSEVFTYNQLFWCAELSELVSHLDKSGIRVSVNKKKIPICGAEIWLDQVFETFPTKKNYLISFRHCNATLKAVGLPFIPAHPSGKDAIRWIIQLPEEMEMDRELTAKVIRSLKRTLLRDHLIMETSQISEKVTYRHQTYSSSLVGPRLLLAPAVYYLGPQLTIDSTTPTCSSLDRIAINYGHLINEIGK